MTKTYSQITIEDIKEYGRIDFYSDDALLEQILVAGKSRVETYTGQSSEYLDTKLDTPLALLATCIDLYDNRGLKTSNNSLNPTITEILNSYRVNLLPEV